jgi:hypothetical protein
MAPRAGLPRGSIGNELDCQTSVTAPSDTKSVSRAVSNQQFRALVRYEVKQHDFKMFEADS